MTASASISSSSLEERQGASAPSVLITGAASYFGRRVAERLVRDRRFPRLIGLDYIDPTEPLDGVEHLRADLFEHDLRALFRAERVRAILHLLWIPEPLDLKAAYRVNVLGTDRLAAAAADSGVEHLVFRSSTAVYGPSPSHPAFLAEESEPDDRHGDRRTHHMLEVEARLERVRARTSMRVASLRFAPILGVRCESRLSAYLRPRAIPTPLGFDPRIQLAHEDDVIDALVHALATGFDGVVNVAAAGVTPLHRVLRLLGRTAVPLFGALLPPALRLHALLGGRPHLRMDAEALRFPPVADLARMAGAFGFRPRWDSIEAIREFGDATLEARVPDSDLIREARAERDRLARALEALSPGGGERHAA